MAIMKFNEQFYRNYNELYTMIKQCYCEVAILEAYIELQKDRPDLYNKVINISNQFVFLLQKDLELTLWKIYYDNDSKANTIPKFRNTVNDILRNCNCPDKQVKKQKGNRKTEETVKIMRRQFLAHTDMTRDDNRIEVSDMCELLDVMCKEFNWICEVVDDDQVIGISENEIGKQKYSCQMQLLSLYIQKQDS